MTRCWLLFSVLAALPVTGCFDPPADVKPDADLRDATPIDAEPDAAPACTASTTTCSNDHYVDCGADGTVAFEMDCPLGCDGTVAKCRDVDPSNGVAMYLDQARTDPDAPALVLGEGSTIDTDTGVVFDGAVSVVVPNADLAGDNRVFMVKSLSVTGTTKVSGGRGLIIVSNGAVSLTGTLDVSADLQLDGPGGGSGTCDGHDATAATFPGGAGGAGNGDDGAPGGTSNNGASAGGGAGSKLVDNDLDPLRGGCPGGRSRLVGSSCTSGNGGGGGAVQIVSRTEIGLTTTGVIDASGGGGVSAQIGVEGCSSTGARGGGGGGSGGSVLLEAPQVRFEGGAVVVSTKGGGGSAGGIGSTLNGSDGGVAAGYAPGGTALSGAANGGGGGTEEAPPYTGYAANANGWGGGGGGAIGQARFNTSSGTVNPQGGAALRTKWSAGTLRTRLVP